MLKNIRFILLYINIPAAIEWSEEIFAYCQQLKTNPQMGHMVPEFQRQDIRELIHDNYRLIYELKDAKIDMLTVWHSRKHSPKSPKEL